VLLEIKNFRAIREVRIELAPITVLYGPNGAGKSSLLYALLTLKNAILNSNSASSAFFNFGFASLGGFDAVVFDHQIRNDIELYLAVQRGESVIRQGLAFGESKGVMRLSGQLESTSFNAEMAVPFPYPANQQTQIVLPIQSETATITWNGITSQLQSPPPQSSPQTLEVINRAVGTLNSVVEQLRKVTIVPLKRGFSKPFYQTQPLSPLLITEEEVATYLSTDKYLVAKVSYYLEKILDRDFRVNFQGGTAIFSLDATDNQTGVASELVNEGFGVDQMVYFLAKSLSRDVEWTCVEEPEIHLHPTAVRNFGRALNEIVNNEGKRFLVSTHSEAFLTSLLALVAEGKLNPENIACFYVHKDGKRATFERQVVHPDGQIEGGLTSFMEGELRDVRSFLKIPQ
jgi:hypothetical protein